MIKPGQTTSELWQHHSKTAEGDSAIIKRANDYIEMDYEAARNLLATPKPEIKTIEEAADYFCMNETGSVSIPDTCVKCGQPESKNTHGETVCSKCWLKEQYAAKGKIYEEEEE